MWIISALELCLACIRSAAEQPEMGLRWSCCPKAEAPTPNLAQLAIEAAAGRISTETLNTLVPAIVRLQSPRETSLVAQVILRAIMETTLPTEREAICAMIRCDDAVLHGIVRFLDHSTSRLAGLKMLRLLTSDAYDSCARETRVALERCDTLRAVRSFIYLSPNARSGGDGDHAHLCATVFYALCVLTNLICTVETGRTIHHSGLEILSELSNDREHWAGPSIRAAAQMCMRNVERACDTSSPRYAPKELDQFEQFDITTQPEFTIDQQRRPRCAPPAHRIGAPSHRQGFHDFSEPLQLLTVLPTFPHTSPGEHAQQVGSDCCTICLEDFQVGELLTALPCLHRFHAECIRGWVESHSVCGRPARGCCCPNCNRPI